LEEKITAMSTSSYALDLQHINNYNKLRELTY